MKTEWTLGYEARDFRFDKKRTFDARVHAAESFDTVPDMPRSAVISVVPDDSREPGEADQVGDILVTVPGRPEETRGFALSSAQYLADRLAFQYGDFRLKIIVLRWKRIPESDAEIAEIDGRPCGVEFEVEEVLPTPSYRPEIFASLGTRHLDARLLAQFNSASRLTDPVQKFLAYYRVLESLCHGPDGRTRAREAFRNHVALRKLFGSLRPNADYGQFIDHLVAVRHECAHLRLSSDFGYAPHDSRIRDEVVPNLEIVEALARLVMVHHGEDVQDA